MATNRHTFLAGLALTLAALGASPVSPPSARADVVAYLVNVTVRPGYNFANADAAIQYGQAICAQAAHGRPYATIIGELKAEFSTSDDYQAAYLISQAVNELCPALIWQLRSSAAHYRPSAAP